MDKLLLKEKAENRILFIRDKEVMLDADLAELYGVSTGELNRRVKKNEQRFPNEMYMFELTDEEKKEIVTNVVHLEKLKFSPHNPKAFTEYGVIMMSTVLDSDIAIQVCHILVETFVMFRKSQKTIETLRQEIEMLKDALQHQAEQYAMHFQVIFREIQALKQQQEKNQITEYAGNQIGFLPLSIVEPKPTESENEE